MREKHLYEYAVMRYLPRVEREEFINIGLVMMSKRRRWIKARVSIDERRFNGFDNELTLEELQRQCDGFVRIAAGDSHSGPIAELLPEERFRWLTAVKSSCLQTSRPHPGKCKDLDVTFERLFDELVR